jgi:hypothetical protein
METIRMAINSVVQEIPARDTLKMLGADDAGDQSLTGTGNCTDPAVVARVRPLVHLDPTVHPVPEASAQERTALREDIKARRQILQPIDVDEKGRIIDGLERWQLANEFELDCPLSILFGMTDQQLREFCRVANACRRSLGKEQKKQMIREQLRDTPQYSDQRIGGICGCDHSAVEPIREFLVASGEIRHFEKRLGKDGKWRRVASVSYLGAAGR